ncbi:MAG: tetraacyldisaccharide 4'-kinase [Paracoccaceae bacterium]
MRAPAFWSNPPDTPGAMARALAPLGRLYALATARRVAKGPAGGVAVPVICVGNLTAGGAGKTPTVIVLAERLAARGIAAHVVSRGYGGTFRGPVRVDPARHVASETGDEPLLLSAFAPTWVARDRLAGARAAVAAGAGAILLDDGFQDPALARDAAILVADAMAGFGNGLCIPAGPLREPVAAGLARADLLLTLGDPAEQAAFGRLWGAGRGLPRAEGALVPLQTGMDWQGLRAFAFAGIGRPEKFFASLRALGAEVVRAEALDDHAALPPSLMRRFAAEARAMGAQLVTTEKDAVRLSPALREGVLVLPVRLRLADWGPVDRVLERAMGTKGRG